MAEKLKCLEIGIIGRNRVIRSHPMSAKDAKDRADTFAVHGSTGRAIYLTSKDIYIPAHAIAWIEVVDYNGEQE